MPFVVALGAGLVMVPAARWLGTALGMVDRPGDPLAIHRRPVSLLGGVAVVAATLLGVVAIGRAPSVGVVGGLVAALAVGLVDDLRPLPAWVRLAGQGAAGLLLVLGGLRLAVFGPLDQVAVVVLILLLANAVNIVDGQDGLAGGLALIAALGLVTLLGWDLEDPATALAVALAGGLLAFLLWNRPPARVFLGNGGAYGVAAILAVPVTATVGRLGWVGLAAAVACLGVFAYELMFTVVRRSRAGTPIAAGDRLHSYDLLSRRVGRTASTIAMWAVGAASAGVAVLLGSQA
jgi:UDP-GlcNAc:undecaprenyl-phosphate GlcNAc-1-phosphate transferase